MLQSIKASFKAGPITINQWKPSKIGAIGFSSGDDDAIKAEMMRLMRDDASITFDLLLETLRVRCFDDLSERHAWMSGLFVNTMAFIKAHPLQISALDVAKCTCDVLCHNACGRYVHPPVRPSVGPSIHWRPSVHPSVRSCANAAGGGCSHTSVIRGHGVSTIAAPRPSSDPSVQRGQDAWCLRSRVDLQ